MIDWLSSMQQTYEYYIVDPLTWKDTQQIDGIKSCSIERNSEAETLGSATLEITELMKESYVRVYLIVIQNENRYKVPLGTFLVQSQPWSFDGKAKSISVDAYTSLLELKDNYPPIGYSLMKDDNVMDMAYRICRENSRIPVVKAECSTKLCYNFVANSDDTWLSFLTDLISNAKYKFELDETGKIMFAPEQDMASLQPVWTYNDDNSSILYPDISLDQDLYGIPNVIEVIYSTGSGYNYYKAINDDPNSPTSTVSRGREIVYRDTNPNLTGSPTNEQAQEYAERLLDILSTVECTVTYSHGYCPVRVGDCVRLNYSRSGLVGIKAKVIKQTIDCTTSCKVTETAVYTTKVWRQ